MNAWELWEWLEELERFVTSPARAVRRLIVRLSARMLGRLLVIGIGLFLCLLGGLLTLSVVGAIVGIPLLLVGAAIVLQGLWPF